nr:hypothetical protein GCM10020241_34300 [Streptoalloteichus tenebrarius]
MGIVLWYVRSLADHDAHLATPEPDSRLVRDRCRGEVWRPLVAIRRPADPQQACRVCLGLARTLTKREKQEVKRTPKRPERPRAIDKEPEE